MRIRLAVAAVIIAFGVPLVALTGPASAAGGPAVCTISGSTFSAKGLSTTSQTISVSFSGKSTCVGGGSSGGGFGGAPLAGRSISALSDCAEGGAELHPVGLEPALRLLERQQTGAHRFLRDVLDPVLV